MATTALPNVDIVCLGSAMVDFVGIERTDNLGNAETFRREAGGAPIYVAGTAARLQRPAAIVARVGMDVFGHYYQQEARRLGIHTEWIQVDASKTTTVAFFAGHATPRDFLVVRGADKYLQLDDQARSLIDSAKALHLSTFVFADEPSRSAAVEAVERAHHAGKVVSLDPNFRSRFWPEPASFMPLLEHLLPLTTVIKPSLADAEAIWGAGMAPGDYIEQFHAHGARKVLLTLGREGVLVSDGIIVQRIPAMPIDITDTVGVGDAFTAGAIAALIDRRSLLTAARVGTLVASYTLRARRDTEPLPRWATLIEQIKAQDDPFVIQRRSSLSLADRQAGGAGVSPELSPF